MSRAVIAAEKSAVEETSSSVLAGVVVHWRNERELEQLLAEWPTPTLNHQPQDRQESSFPLVVVDNSCSTSELQKNYKGDHILWITPGTNLGFAGGVNRGVAATSSPWVLLLNPDAIVSSTALQALAAAASEWGEAEETLAAIAPRLVNAEGLANQFQWQLRPLTQRRHLLAQCFFLSAPRGPASEPAAKALVGQPAAAALLVRRTAFDRAGGFDQRFQPAWFEDVDFAHRINALGFSARYLPEAEVQHEGGTSVPSLGFAKFLQVYYRNLRKFAQARDWALIAAAVPALVASSALLRIPLTLFRKPKAAISKAAAASAFAQLALAALTGWRWVKAASIAPPDSTVSPAPQTPPTDRKR